MATVLRIMVLLLVWCAVTSAERRRQDSCMLSWILRSGLPYSKAIAVEKRMLYIGSSPTEVSRTSARYLTFTYGVTIRQANSLKSCFAGTLRSCQRYSPCKNGGWCGTSFSKKHHLCRCPLGYRGRRCERPYRSPVRDLRMLERKFDQFTKTMRSEMAKLKVATKKNTRTLAGPSRQLARCASPAGQILDPAKSSSRITVSKNGRMAWNTRRRSHNAAVVGKVGYRSGKHCWTFRVNGMVWYNGLGVGVTTLPVDGNSYERSWSPGTVYAWFSNNYYGGLAKSQTSGRARMQRWANNDIMTLTLNYEARTLELLNHSTKEKKTITGVRGSGRPLYLWVFLGMPGHRIIFI